MTTIEQLAGVPSAAELDALANAWFPDLTENVYGFTPEGASVPAVPEVNAAGPLQGYTLSDPGTTQNIGSSMPGKDIPEFDWEHPFAYGGIRQIRILRA